MKQFKRWISCLLVFCMVLSMIPVTARAAESGTCGENVTWHLSDDGVLTISGTGPMAGYSSSRRAPWYNSRSSVKSVVIADGVTNIGSYAFNNCDGLTSATIGNSVTFIGSDAFLWCENLINITIPDSVTSIGEDAFACCRNLTSVTISSNVTSIGRFAFGNCSSLKGIYVDSNNSTYSSDSYGVLFNNAKTRLIQAPWTLSGHYAIPNSVTSIDSHAFFKNTSLGFGQTDLLTSVTIPDSVTYIGSYAFEGCTGLTSVTIPDSVTSIGSRTFRECDSLTSVTIPDSVTSIGTYAFYDCDALTSVTIGNSVTSIGEDAFACCRNLTSVAIGNSVTSIGDYAFKDCGALTSIAIPDSVTSMGKYVFYNCRALTNVMIGNNVTHIDGNVFQYCTALTSVTIPDSVTSIGGKAFYYCQALSEIFFRGNVPFIGTDAFEHVTATAYYPAYNPTWTSDVMQNYGGIITWVPYTPVVDTSKPNNGTYTTPQTSVWYNIWCAGDKYKSYERNFTLTVGDSTYSTGDGYTARAEIPYELSNQVSVSKEGWITCQIPRELVYTCREIVLHPDTKRNPFVNFIAARNNGDSIYTNLACSHLSVYENALRTYDLYVDINWNGHTPGKVWLQQGDLTLDLQEGKNVGLMLGMFSASNGDVLLRWETADGTGYSQRIYLDVYKNGSSSIKLNGGDKSESTNPASAEEDEMWGDLKFEIDLFDDTVPVEMTMTPISATKGTFKGSIGIKIENYENKRTIIDLLDTSLNANWDYTTFKSMKDSLKTKYPDALVPQQANSFVVSVDTEFLGYVEGTYTLGQDGSLVDLEFTDSKIVTGLEGEISTARQHLAGYVPWYWELKLEAGMALALELQNEYDGTSASIAPITTETEIKIGAKVAAGVVKTAGLGVKGGGTMHIEGQIVPIDLSKTNIYADYDIALFLQSAHWTADIFPYKSDKYSIMKDGRWVWEDNHSSGGGGSGSSGGENGGGGIRSLAADPDSEMQQISRNYLEANTQTRLLYSSTGRSSNVVYANTYTFTEPQVVQLNDGRMLMVWVDDPGTEIRPLDVNRTALYYSVYNGTAWSEPAMVHDDGTADASPVLRNIDGSVYLIWSNCNTLLAEDAQYEDYAAALDIAYARFDSESGVFVDVSAVDTNAHSDFLHDITVVNGIPTIAWIQNSENDLLWGTGNNTLYEAQLKSGAWEVTVLANNLSSVDGLSAANKNDTLTVYISQDTDGDVSTVSDREVYAVSDDAMTRITDNTVSDLKPLLIDDTLYWYQDGTFTDGANVVELVEDTDRIVVAENDTQTAVLYKRYNDDSTTTILAHVLSDGVWSCAIELVTIDQYVQYFDAEMLNDGSIIIITNAIDMADNSFGQADLCMYRIAPECDLDIQSFTYNPLSIAPFGNLELIATIQNNSSESVKEVNVQLYDGETLLQEEVIALDLNSGTESTMMLTYPLTEINPASIRLNIQPIGQDDRNSANNTAKCTIPWADVSVEELTAIQTNTGTHASVYISNRGLTELSDIHIELYTQENGKKNIIASKEIDTIAAAMGELVTFEANLESETAIYVNATVELDEFNVANNSGFTLIAEQSVVLNSDDATPHVHQYESDVIAPTCTEAGSTTYTCACGDTYTEGIDALGHHFENGSCTACGEEDTSYIPGDVNGDSRVNGKDSILLAQYLAEWEVEIDLKAADVNGDGRVNGKDSILLAQYLAEWDVTLG